MIPVLIRARIEARRAARALSRGSPAGFWERRLRRAIADLDAAREVLEAAIPEAEIAPTGRCRAEGCTFHADPVVPGGWCAIHAHPVRP